MPQTIFFKFFSKKAEILQKYFELSAQQNSNVNRGANREIFISEFSNKILPKKLHIATGEVIDHEGRTTGQLDTIIVRNDTPALDFGGKNIYLAGGVFAVIEIKSILSATKLTEAYETLSKVSVLTTPAATILIGFAWPSGVDIFKIVFAYSGQKLKTIAKTIKDKKMIKTIDIVCILDKGILMKRNIMKELSDDYTKYESFDDDNYVAINSSAAALAFLYSVITQFGNTFLGGKETIEPYLLNPEDTWNKHNSL